MKSRNSSQSNETKSDYIDKKYQNTAISMMKKAREDFLAFRKETNYKKGTSIGILLDALHSNVNFMVETRKLFS